jgi:hypothetical protein
LGHRSFARIHFTRREDKDRIAAIDVGVPATAYSPVSIADPQTSQLLTVYQQNPATFGKDQYLLTNPAGLQSTNTGLLAEAGTEWHGVTLHGSWLREKSSGLTNPGNSAIENDSGVIGGLYLDPNTLVNATRGNFADPGYLAKFQATYHLPSAWGGIQMATVVNYVGGLQFDREILVTGLSQGPFLVPAATGYRAQDVVNWNLRLARDFVLRLGKITFAADILNVVNSNHAIQESDVTGLNFNLRLPMAIQEPRSIRFQIRYEY